MGGFKELGLYVIKHTDGKLWPILDMIVDLGHRLPGPDRPQAGMDLSEVKAVRPPHRPRKAAWTAQLMTFGTPEEVVEATKEAAPGRPRRGFIRRPATRSIRRSGRKIMQPCCAWREPQALSAQSFLTGH